MRNRQYFRPGDHHRLTLKFLAEGTALRDQVQQFAAGAQLETLPQLEEEVSILIMLMTSERDIEGLHAAGNPLSSKAHHISAQYRSLTFRFPEIREKIQDPSFFKTFAELVESCRSADLLEKLGLTMHPAVVHSRIANPNQKMPACQVWKIIYHCEVETQHHMDENIKKKIDKSTRKKAAYIPGPKL